MKNILWALLLNSLFCFNLYALAVKRVSVEERITGSSLVVIGKILQQEEISDNNYTMKAKVLIENSSIDGYVGKEIEFYHSSTIEETATHCCATKSKYLLFLRKYKNGYSSSSGRFGAYEIIPEVSLFLDETWMRTSLEHAEVLLYLHNLSQPKKE